MPRFLRYALARDEDRQRLETDLRNCAEATARWQRHADSYAHELRRTTRERAQLLAWLAALHPASAVVTVFDDPDGSMDSYCLRLVAGGRVLSWPIARDDLPLFDHVPCVVTASPYETHVEETAERAAHLRQHTRLLARDGAEHHPNGAAASWKGYAES
ncbi:hypothetical protein [Streptomyces sp. NPDC001286]